MIWNIDFWRDFYNGRVYPALVALLILLGHATGQEVIFGAVMLATLIPACLICHNLRFALMPFMCTIFIVSAKTYSPGDTGYAERYLRPSVLIPAGVVLICVAAAFVYFVVRNAKTANAMPKNGSLFGLLIFCGTLFCNGFFGGAYDPKNLFFAFMIALSMVAVYILFALFLDIDGKVFDHFLFCLALTGLLICAELIVAYLTTVQFINGEIVKGSVVLGWGVWTHIGGMLTFLLPAHFYFAASHRNGWFGMLTGFLQYFCIVLSQSRGALLIGTFMLLICLIYLLFKGENRRTNRFIILGVFLVGALGVLLMYNKLISLVQNFLSMGFDDNGRFALWRSGIEKFLSRPVFGTGFYDCYVPQAHDGWAKDLYPYLYHCTPIQILASAGLFGMLAYLYHRFCTLRLMLRRPDPHKTFLGLCMIGLLLFSLTDVLFFKTYPTIIYALILLVMDRRDAFSEKTAYL